MTVTDEELVARSIAGDTDSFNQLILRWERPIYALAYRTLGREEDARDVCQETFLRAFRSLAGLTTEPASGSSRFAKMRSSVVLPAPFGPHSPTVSRSDTCQVTSSSRTRAPNDLATDDS